MWKIKLSGDRWYVWCVLACFTPWRQIASVELNLATGCWCVISFALQPSLPPRKDCLVSAERFVCFRLGMVFGRSRDCFFGFEADYQFRSFLVFLSSSTQKLCINYTLIFLVCIIRAGSAFLFSFYVYVFFESDCLLWSWCLYTTASLDLSY